MLFNGNRGVDLIFISVLQKSKKIYREGKNKANYIYPSFSYYKYDRTDLYHAIGSLDGQLRIYTKSKNKESELNGKFKQKDAVNNA